MLFETPHLFPHFGGTMSLQLQHKTMQMIKPGMVIQVVMVALIHSEYKNTDFYDSEAARIYPLDIKRRGTLFYTF